MDFNNFLRDILGVTKDFEITKIDKDEPKKTIYIHLRYLPNKYLKDGEEYSFYDHTPQRTWQHLNWFEYKCYLVGSLPGYLNKEGKAKVIDINFAPKSKGYTCLFSREIIKTLQAVRVQSTVANLFHTTPYIVRSIMENAVNFGLETRGLLTDFTHISLDEKAYSHGHKYATILIDSDKNVVLDLVDGRKEKDVRELFLNVSGNKKQPQIKRIRQLTDGYVATIYECSQRYLQRHNCS